MVAKKQHEPRAVRPTGPPGYWRSRPIPWQWARQRLVDARNYWIATVSPDGVPHARPVWGVWLDDDRLYFDTGSRVGRYVQANPQLTVHLESADEVVIVEGTAKRVRDRASIARFLAAYNPKYLYEMTAPPGALFVVTPRVAYGWVSDPTGLDNGAIFGSTGTRWEFE
jgi:uncharacterized pyridoxamine 5'-phosphate oxidase family protein